MTAPTFTAPAAECTDTGGHYPHSVTVERDGERLVAQCEGSQPVTRAMVEGWVQEYVAALDANWQAQCAEHYPNSDTLKAEHYGYSVGPKYARVYKVMGYGGKSAEAFVDMATGDVYKPDGWKRPAKGVRYSLAAAEKRAALLSAAGQAYYLYR